MKNNYHVKNHSKYLIKLHFVLSVKYRKGLLVGLLKDDMQSDVNHVHFLLDIEPKFSALEIIHQIKQISTFRIYKKYNSFFKKHFWNENTFWNDGYFVCSTGDASTETIRKYIAEQG